MMKKLIALLLVFFLLANLNCVSIHTVKLDGDEGFVSCKAVYVGGSIDIARGEKGALIVKNESIQFKYKGEALDIQYEKINSMQYDKNLNKVLPSIPEPNFWKYTQRKTSPSFWDALLYLGIILVIVGIVVWVTSRDQIYINFDYNTNNKDEWATFKINVDEFDQIYLILKDKTDLR